MGCPAIIKSNKQVERRVVVRGESGAEIPIIDTQVEFVLDISGQADDFDWIVPKLADLVTWSALKNISMTVTRRTPLEHCEIEIFYGGERIFDGHWNEDGVKPKVSISPKGDVTVTIRPTLALTEEDAERFSKLINTDAVRVQLDSLDGDRGE